MFDDVYPKMFKNFKEMGTEFINGYTAGIGEVSGDRLAIDLRMAWGQIVLHSGFQNLKDIRDRVFAHFEMRATEKEPRLTYLFDVRFPPVVDLFELCKTFVLKYFLFVNQKYFPIRSIENRIKEQAEIVERLEVSS